MLAGKGISTCPLCTDPNKDSALVFILQIRMFYHWNVEIPNRFYFQNKYLKVLLLSHPLFQVLSLQSVSDSAHSGLIYEQECGICRCPWSGTHWTVHVRDVSEECLGLTSSVFADGYTNTEGASAIFHRKGESKYVFKWRETADQVKSILTELVSLVDKEMHHWTVPLCATLSTCKLIGNSIPRTWH